MKDDRGKDAKDGCRGTREERHGASNTDQIYTIGYKCLVSNCPFVYFAWCTYICSCSTLSIYLLVVLVSGNPLGELMDFT